MKTKNFIPDLIFPTNNELEIPTLRLDMQPQGCEIPFVCYGEQKRTYKMNGSGTLHFYTDDYRFNTIFKCPEKIFQHDPANIVEPNFSLFNETPIAYGLQAIYKKRFIARALQERGIGVFVDLNVAPKFYALNLLGVPRGYQSFCTRGYEDRINALEIEHEIAKMVAENKHFTFVVYGGGESVKAWCRTHESVYVSPIIAIKNKLKSLENQLKQGALLPDNCTLELSAIKNALFTTQIANYNEK